MKSGRPRHLARRREILLLNLTLGLAFEHRGSAHDPVPLILTSADPRLIVGGRLIQVSIIKHDGGMPDVVEWLKNKQGGQKRWRIRLLAARLMMDELHSRSWNGACRPSTKPGCDLHVRIFA